MDKKPVINEKKQIVIDDPVIISYYRENPNLNIVIMNHIFIDILKSLSTNLLNTTSNTINQKILTLVSELNSNLTNIKTDIVSKLHDYKKEYIEDVKIILSNNILTNEKNIGTLIEKNNEHLLTKTTLVINDILPKTNEKSFNQIENCVKSFCSNISNDITKIIETTNKSDNKEENIQQIVNNIENKFNTMVTNIQQPIFSVINKSEERTTTEIREINNNLNIQLHNNTKLTTEINDFLNKYKNNSSVKGNVSETELYFLLQTLMPTDEIVKVSTDTASCDFKVNRKDPTKPTILFENKDYTRTVNSEEIKKFERDVQLQKNHGIMISQNSPITFKDNFQIDVINGFIHVYIPNANYNLEKIKIAIDIIDNLSFKIYSMSSDCDNEYLSLSKHELDDITEEYRLFGIQKSQMIDTIKLVTKQLVDKMEEIQLPKLKKILIKGGNVENDNDFKCVFCNSWSGKNKASLAAHLRNCKYNPKSKENSVSVPEINIKIETKNK
jgi:hypothetical protein